MLEHEFAQEVEKRKNYNRIYLLNNLIEASGISPYDTEKINNLEKLMEKAIKDGLLTELYTVKEV